MRGDVQTRGRGRQSRHRRLCWRFRRHRRFQQRWRPHQEFRQGQHRHWRLRTWWRNGRHGMTSCLDVSQLDDDVFPPSNSWITLLLMTSADLLLEQTATVTVFKHFHGGSGGEGVELAGGRHSRLEPEWQRHRPPKWSELLPLSLLLRRGQA
jgi:hypothetical protein